MNRKPFVAGNWKMNKTAAEAAAFVRESIPGLVAIPGVEQVLCPAATALATVAPWLKGSGIGLGALRHPRPLGAAGSFRRDG
jgi:triosephosphate isomerase